MTDKYDVYGALTVWLEMLEAIIKAAGDDPAKLAQIERVLKSLIEAYADGT